MKIGFYFCDKKTGRNSIYKIHMLFNYDKDWEEMSLRNRGLLGNRFFVRDATREEIREYEAQYRAYELKYKSIKISSKMKKDVVYQEKL